VWGGVSFAREEEIAKEAVNKLQVLDPLEIDTIGIVEFGGVQVYARIVDLTHHRLDKRTRVSSARSFLPVF
jgi:hypothetical protein